MTKLIAPDNQRKAYLYGTTRETFFREESVCPICGKELKQSASMQSVTQENKTMEAYSTSFRNCDNGHFVSSFIPLPHQYRYMEDSHEIKLNFGAYGQGKTYGDIYEVIKHIFLVPNAVIYVIANTISQAKRAFLDDFLKIMPADFVFYFNNTNMEYIFTNGASLFIVASDNENKLRSANVTLYLLIEANGIKEEIKVQMDNRLRNPAATIYEKDKDDKIVYELDEETKALIPKAIGHMREALIETNPAPGWVYALFLSSDVIKFFGKDSWIQYNYQDHNPDVYASVAGEGSNPYLTKDWYTSRARGKDELWIRQNQKAHFVFEEHLVYPNALRRFVPRRAINYHDPNCYFLVGFDYGLLDPTGIIFAQFNFETHKLTVYDEIDIRNASVKEIISVYGPKLKMIPRGKLLMPPIMDGKSLPKRGGDKVSIGDLFEQEGYFFIPSNTGVEARNLKLNSLIDLDQIEIFDDLLVLKKELKNYKKPTDKNGKLLSKKPLDKNNHKINALEFIVMELPMNLLNGKIHQFIQPGQVHDGYKVETNGENQLARFKELSNEEQQVVILNPFRKDQTELRQALIQEARRQNDLENLSEIPDDFWD